MDLEATSPGKIRFLMSRLENRYLLLGLRLLVGLAFVAAGAEKIADPESFGLSIGNYRILPDFLVPVPATVLPWLELLCGLAILFGILVRGSSLIVSLLLVIFTLAVLSAILRGLDISCGCFSQDAQEAVLGWGKVWENLGLLFASLVLLYAGEGPLSLRRYLQREGKA